MNGTTDSDETKARQFLGVHFASCRVYGRLYRTRDGLAYEGRCPRCGRMIRVPIGSHGTSQRFFVVDCGT